VLKITILGSGTSSGVPTIGCHCPTCQSTDPRDKRLRPSIWLQTERDSIVIDTSSDFRQQCLTAGIEAIDAIIYTHHHFDHISGFDDIRAYNFKTGRPVPIFLTSETYQNLERIFNYALNPSLQNESGVPLVQTRIIAAEPFMAGTTPIIPIPLQHGRMAVNGYRIGNFAYCTDCNYITEESYEKLEGLDLLILDALRISTHPTHFSLQEAIRAADRINAKATYFTHIAHDIKHSDIEAQLPPGMGLLYDGLELYADNPV
jgi:phosphoribosyl 1,2-cyclic phosphate phosphodiesterase